jgi:ADP-ribose pyrophosphatase
MSKNKSTAENSNKAPLSLLETTLHSEMVYQGRFLKVMRDQVQLPNGGIGHREYILHPGAAAILPVLDSGEILLVEQYRHALKKVFLEVPAGKRDKGEDPALTASRELEEETGFKAGKLEFMTIIHPVIGYADEAIYLFKATELIAGPQKLDHGEFLELRKFTSIELKEKVKKGEITDVKTLISLFWHWSL